MPTRQRGKTIDGKRHPQKWINIGRPELMSAEEARGRVRTLKAIVADGRDPASEMAEAKRQTTFEASRRLTLAEAAERYLEFKKSELRPSSFFTPSACK